MDFQGRCHDPRNGLRNSPGVRTGFSITKHIRRYACRRDLDTRQHVRSHSDNSSGYHKTPIASFSPPNPVYGTRSPAGFSSWLLTRNECQTKLVVLSGVDSYLNATRQENPHASLIGQRTQKLGGTTSGFFGWHNKPTGQQERRRCRARPTDLVGRQPVRGESRLYPAARVPVSGR